MLFLNHEKQTLLSVIGRLSHVNAEQGRNRSTKSPFRTTSYIMSASSLCSANFLANPQGRENLRFLAFTFLSTEFLPTEPSATKAGRLLVSFQRSAPTSTESPIPFSAGVVAVEKTEKR